MVAITLCGTCRLKSIRDTFNGCHLINYPHCTKEVIQYIKFFTKELLFPFPYSFLCFRVGVDRGVQFRCEDAYTPAFWDTDTFVIEICSRKKYIHNGFYLHHTCVDTRPLHSNPIILARTPKEITDNHTVETQTDEEIEGDILEIQRMVHPRKIVIVSHYNSKMNGEYIPARNDLITLLGTVCEKHDISFVNPTEVLSAFPQEQVMDPDLGHYTELGVREFSNYMNNYLKECDV